MTFSDPVSADLKARFPAFVDVDDAIINTALAEAALRVDQSWLSQDDFTLGRLLYAAHVLTLDGHGAGIEAELARSGTLSFQTMRSGSLTLTRGNSAGTGNQSAGSTLNQTQFGRRYAELAFLNAGGPIVANAP